MEFAVQIIAAILLLRIYDFIRLYAFNDGVLRVDLSNPEKHIYRFEVDNLKSLSNKKRIVIRVDNKADLSH